MLMGLLLAGAVAAPEPVLVQPNERADYQAMLDNTARTANRSLWADCKDTTLEHLSTTPIRGDRPDIAAARERVKVTGCGHSAVENINVVRFGPTSWAVTFGLPGESHANYQVQITALPQIIAGIRKDLPAGCQGVRVGDVYVTAWPGDILFYSAGEARPAPPQGKFPMILPEQVQAEPDKFDLNSAWSEYWPLEVCGQDRSQLIIFMTRRDRSGSMFLSPVWQGGPAARPAPAPRPADPAPPAGR
jgi:hypothetical protein